MSRFGLSVTLVALLPLAAAAQQAQQAQPQMTMAERNLQVAIQQIVPAVSLLAEEAARKLAEKDARIAELEKLCGDACKKVPNPMARAQ